MIRVGNVWYPKYLKKIAREMTISRYKAFISEKQKMERIYRPTGRPKMFKPRL
jgi:hypothetical protein